MKYFVKYVKMLSKYSLIWADQRKCQFKVLTNLNISYKICNKLEEGFREETVQRWFFQILPRGSRRWWYVSTYIYNYTYILFVHNNWFIKIIRSRGIIVKNYLWNSSVFFLLKNHFQPFIALEIRKNLILHPGWYAYVPHKAIFFY